MYDYLEGHNKIKRGCRCGNATPNPGKLTCCGQRCPCYVNGKGCAECRCRGCRNPHERNPSSQVPAAKKPIYTSSSPSPVPQVLVSNPINSTAPSLTPISSSGLQFTTRISNATISTPSLSSFHAGLAYKTPVLAEYERMMPAEDNWDIDVVDLS